MHDQLNSNHMHAQLTHEGPHSKTSLCIATYYVKFCTVNIMRKASHKLICMFVKNMLKFMALLSLRMLGVVLGLRPHRLP